MSRGPLTLLPLGLVRVTDADRKAVREIAAREGSTVSQIVRRAVRAEIERAGKREPNSGETEMKRKTVSISQGLEFVVPPENRGQIVTTSYACDEQYIYEMTVDSSDGERRIDVYRHPVRGEFEPQNGAPRLGRRVGTVRQ